MKRRWFALATLAIVAISAAIYVASSGRDAPQDARSQETVHRVGATHGNAPNSQTDSANGEPPETANAPGPTSSRPLRLSPAEAHEDPGATRGVLTGKVLSWADLAPVAGAEISFRHLGRSASVTTDEAGSFRFEPSATGEHVLFLVTAEAHHPYSPGLSRSALAFVARPGVRVDGVVLYLVPEARYSGLVVDGAGEPVADAEITLGDGEDRDALAPTAEREWRSDEAGRFEFTAEDGALLVATHPAAGHGRKRLDFAAEASRHVTIELSAGPALATVAIRGVVQTPDGAALPDAQVTAVPTPENPAAPSARTHPLGHATTDSEGRFFITGLEAETYRLTASAAGWASARLSVEAPATDVRLVLGEEARLSGTVRDEETGAPIAASTVVVEKRSGPLMRLVVATATTLDGDGRYEVHGLRPGSYEVSATAHGYAETAPRAVEVGTDTVSADDDDSAEVDFSLGRGGTLSGVVTSGDSEDAEPIVGARVSLEGRLGGGESAVPLLTSDTTDEAGAFSLTGISPGVRSVLVAAGGHHGRVVSGLPIAAGETRTVHIDLTPTEEGETPRIELVGIGAVLSVNDEGLVIGRVIEGGGAAEAGLGPDDVILKVDGTAVVELGFGGSIERIRGPENSTLTLEVRRAGRDAPEVVVVTRRRIRA